jgi:hypothetical protein
MNPSQRIDKQIADAAGWKGEILASLRELIHEADSEIIEDWKWDTAVFTHKGLVCAISAFKDHVKINFFKGALLKDLHELINGGLDSKSHRSIDFYEGDNINGSHLRDLIKEAATLNL